MILPRNLILLGLGWGWGGALVMLGILFLTDTFRGGTHISRLHDGQWFAWLAAPIYMLHQFEEYALHYDWGKLSHPFADMVCQKIGYEPYPNCPIPIQHYWLVNISLWVFAMVGAGYYRKNPMVALVIFGLVLSNGLLHITGWLTSGNSLLHSASGGTITSILLFVPCSLWFGYILVKQKVGTIGSCIAALAAGVIGHLMLFGGYTFLDKIGLVALYLFDLIAITWLCLFSLWLWKKKQPV